MRSTTRRARVRHGEVEGHLELIEEPLGGAELRVGVGLRQARPKARLQRFKQGAQLAWAQLVE